MHTEDINLELYKKLYLIRKSEDVIKEHYFDDQMKTPMHMSAGGEAIAVGVLSAMKDTDLACGTYRTHALYLAKGGCVNKFFAELFGKKDGTASGKAGSMHLLAPDKGLVCTTAVVGTNIPVALGTAYAAKYNGLDQVTVVFFGDGAVDEGVFWESLNFACLKRLPVIFVYEDNGFAVHTPTSERHGYASLNDIVRQFNCLPMDHIDSNDVMEIHAKDRYLEHVGILEDFNAGYRPIEEYNSWRDKDPVEMQRTKLIELMVEDQKSGYQLTESSIQDIEKDIDKKVNDAFVRANDLSFADTDEIHKDVFSA